MTKELILTTFGKSLSDEVIEELHSIAEGKDMIDDDKFELMEKERLFLPTDDIKLAKLFIECLEFLTNNISNFKTEEEDYRKLIIRYVQSLECNNLRKLINKYGLGKGFGSYMCKQGILDEISENRQKYLNLINIFFKIFGDEE